MGVRSRLSGWCTRCDPGHSELPLPAMCTPDSTLPSVLKAHVTSVKPSQAPASQVSEWGGSAETLGSQLELGSWGPHTGCHRNTAEAVLGSPSPFLAKGSPGSLEPRWQHLCLPPRLPPHLGTQVSLHGSVSMGSMLPQHHLPLVSSCCQLQEHNRLGSVCGPTCGVSQAQGEQELE